MRFIVSTVAPVVVMFLALSFSIAGGAEPGTEQLHQAFTQPPNDCKPHTRWWWMGNALRKEDIAWQLEQMFAQGIGGVEQITMEPVYTKGNHDYLSPEYFELLRFAVEEAERRGMSFSINFGGPGWIWGGEWVPIEDQSQVMLASAVEVDGPRVFSGALPEEAVINPNDVPRSMPVIADEDRLLKVVAARLEEDRLRADSLTDLSSFSQGRSLEWNVPEGRWRIMAFWLTRRDNANAVDPLNRGAMMRYCETLGAQYVAAVGDHFGKTVESFFGDSFEVPIYRNGLYWTDGLFETFEIEKGYPLVLWLPALWWEVDDLSSRIRYDVNEFLHEQGMEAFFQVFLDWCERHGVRGRIQPYGFVTDIMEGAGKTHFPEMEITPGEKDALPWYDTRIGPRAYVASGAHLYGRTIVSTEAFTYLHWEPYRATLEELKIATDGFLCAGANKFYNHGYIASPERDIVPTRGFFAAIRISHENIWWPYYHHLAAYTARCCALLRHGRFVADVAVYSPLANQWTKSVLNARKWTREFDFGGLGQLLAVNGYAFDLINDDVIQRADLNEGALRLGEMTYRVLLLPGIENIPVETFRQIRKYVLGGGIVITLEHIPEAATGFQNNAANDDEVRQISATLFRLPVSADDNGFKTCGDGRTFSLKQVLRREDPLDWRIAPLDPLLKTLRLCIGPDLESERIPPGRGNDEGLAFIHRKSEDMDIYFVANLQHTASQKPLGFRVNNGQPYCWDSHTGNRQTVGNYSRSDGYTWLPISLAPFESRFFVFEEREVKEDAVPHVLHSDFFDVLNVDRQGFDALINHNGRHTYRVYDSVTTVSGEVYAEGLPAVYGISGDWDVEFPGMPTVRWLVLKSWTEEENWRHFSGTARYAVNFNLPETYCEKDVQLRLSLGEVGVIADIRINGKPVGVQWRTGQTFDLDGVIKSGENRLEVDVTNTLINRVSGLEAFPEVPEALRPFFGTGMITSSHAADALLGFEPLPPSGLLGPVTIYPYKKICVEVVN